MFLELRPSLSDFRWYGVNIIFDSFMYLEIEKMDCPQAGDGKIGSGAGTYSLTPVA